MNIYGTLNHFNTWKLIRDFKDMEGSENYKLNTSSQLKYDSD